jgi:hypothetical protein
MIIESLRSFYVKIITRVKKEVSTSCWCLASNWALVIRFIPTFVGGRQQEVK